MKQTVRRTIMILAAFMMVMILVPAAVFAADGDYKAVTGTAYISITDDEHFVTSDGEIQGQIMSYVPVDLAEVSKIDLDDYNLGEFKFDSDGDGVYEITVLQMYLYVLDHYYSEKTAELNITGSAGSMYMQGGFWGHDENLTYYVNGAYPLARAGWGATADQIEIGDGDFVDVSMYSDWNFLGDSKAGYQYFATTSGDITHEYKVDEGNPLAVKLVRSWGDLMSGGESELKDVDGVKVKYGRTLDGDEEGTVETDSKGQAEITFPESGDWYVWAEGQLGEDNPNSIVSTPAAAKVTVKAGNIPVVSANLTIEAQQAGGYLAPFEKTVKVESNLSDLYGYKDTVKGKVSALDALIASHIAVFGGEFTKKTARDYLDVNENGGVSKMYTTDTWANGFLVNKGYPNDGNASQWGGYNGTTVNSTELDDGDVVDFFLYTDDSTYSDYYSFTKVNSDVYAGENADVQVKGNMVMSGYMFKDPAAFEAGAQPLEDAALAWVKMESGGVTLIKDDQEKLIVTDEDGKAVITAPETAGVYYLTAINNDDEEVYSLMNPVKVTVKDSPVVGFGKLVEQLPDVSGITLKDEKKVSDCSKAYDALTVTQKQKVDKDVYIALLGAEKKIAVLKQEQAEKDKQAAEEAKAQAEKDKQAAEGAKAQAEKDKQAAEKAKAQAEKDKQAAEEAKAQAEKDKQAAEEAKAQAEKDKQVAEEAKAQAEKDKQAAEEAKAQAEKDRQAAEEAKAQAEKDKYELEDALKKAKAELNSLKNESKKTSVKPVKNKQKVVGLKAKSKARKITLSWKKVNAAAGYEVQYKVKKSKSYKRLKATASNEVKSGKLKKGKNYAFRVRTYINIGGKKVYGKWSKVKSVKCK